MSDEPKTLHAPTPGLATLVRVVRVIDGDTVEVETLPKTVRVRLLDCWAPESRTRDAGEKVRGIASREHLQSVLPIGCVATLHIPGGEDLGDLTTLGRVLGRLWTPSGVDVSALQTAAGHATRWRS